MYEMFLLTFYCMKSKTIDPLGQPTVTGDRDSHMLSVRPSVLRPHWKFSKTKQQKTMFGTGETVGLAEWIIDATCLVGLLVFDKNIAHGE